MDTATLARLDREVLWHPFTQQRGWEEGEQPLFIDRGHGCTVYDTDGNAYLDGTSSLWCNVHGHGHPALDAAVREQLDKVAHSTMLGLSHAPAVELAQRLVDLAPAGLQRVFYSDSGATAVEIALKMAYGWWAHTGQPQRSSFVCLRMSYHGDTLGSMAVGAIPLFHQVYHPLLFSSHVVEPGDAADLERTLAEHGDTIGAVIVEPLLQGAAGIRPYASGYLRAVRELCDRFGVLMVVDEVATGFGRTGTMFACEQEDVAPDLMCLGKGLTGGYLPLAATLATERIYEGFLGAFEELKSFFHGHTYTGNPLACAAALANLDVFEREDTLAHVARNAELLGALLDEHVAPLPTVREIRRVGLMTGIELVDFPLPERMGHQVTLAARARGAIVRPLGDTITLMPALAMSPRDLERLVTITAAAIAEATGVVAAPAARVAA